MEIIPCLRILLCTLALGTAWAMLPTSVTRAEPKPSFSVSEIVGTRTFLLTVGVRTYANTKGEVYDQATASFHELAVQLDRFKALGVSHILFLASWTAGAGGTQEWNTNASPDLSEQRYELQRAIRDSQIMVTMREQGIKPIWVIYLGSYWGPTPGGGWFDDKKWNHFLGQVRTSTFVLHHYGCNSFGFDAEMYGERFTWDWDFPGNTRSEAEVRAKARERGEQYMRVYAETVPGVKVFTFPADYEKQVHDWFYAQALPDTWKPSKTVWDDFVAGMLSARGWGKMYFSPEVFYKNTQRLGPWDTALANWKTQFFRGLAARTEDWEKVQPRLGIVFGTWLDGATSGTGEYYQPITPDRAAQQLPAMARHGDDFIWIYRQLPLTFDYGPYSVTMREIAGMTRSSGPLRVHPTNARYFTEGTKNPDGSLKAVYLTGSHTWANLIDRGPADPPPAFDFTAYLDLLQQQHHNFIRLWGRHVTWYHGYGEGELHAAPLAWSRPGPGIALDGKPKFDLTQLNPAYFDRLRARVIAARDRGIYVGIMLFGGSFECRGGWRGNPFNAANNVNSVNGDPSADGEGLEAHTLQVPAITRLQEAYVRKVIDTVNDLDNVLFEISNEGEDSSREWQYHLIRYIHQYEAGKPRQHPVGMTAVGSGNAESNQALSASPAEWISPHADAWGGVRNLPAADGAKVSLLDSDHWFVKEIYKDPVFGRDWVWIAFCRGHHPILMEHLPPLSFVDDDYPLSIDDPGYTASRRAMGQTRRLAERMNLAAMTPHSDLASTGCCLANPGKEYLVYLPKDGEITVDLSAASGTIAVEWVHPVEGTITPGEAVKGGSKRAFKAPFSGGAVLHLMTKVLTLPSNNL